MRVGLNLGLLTWGGSWFLRLGSTSWGCKAFRVLGRELLAPWVLTEAWSWRWRNCRSWFYVNKQKKSHLASLVIFFFFKIKLVFVRYSGLVRQELLSCWVWWSGFAQDFWDVLFNLSYLLIFLYWFSLGGLILMSCFAGKGELFKLSRIFVSIHRWVCYFSSLFGCFRFSLFQS